MALVNNSIAGWVLTQQNDSLQIDSSLCSEWRNRCRHTEALAEVSFFCKGKLRQQRPKNLFCKAKGSPPSSFLSCVLEFLHEKTTKQTVDKKSKLCYVVYATYCHCNTSHEQHVALIAEYEVKSNVKEYIKFDFRMADILLVIGISLFCLLLKLFGINKIPENSLVENIQVIILAFATVYCLYQRRKNPEYKAINTFFTMLYYYNSLLIKHQ